jgi:hypothetical protein
LRMPETVSGEATIRIASPHALMPGYPSCSGGKSDEDVVEHCDRFCGIGLSRVVLNG